DSTTYAAPCAEVLRISSCKPYALFLGRLSWKKGLERLLSAFATTTHGALVIAGTDDEGLSARLRVLATKLDIAGRVAILPRTVLGADKEHLYRNAHLFVLPSFSENFGNTIVEAMSYGIPAIVTSEVGSAEIVRQGGGGIVVSGETKSMGDAIQKLLTNGPL